MQSSAPLTLKVYSLNAKGLNIPRNEVVSLLRHIAKEPKWFSYRKPTLNQDPPPVYPILTSRRFVDSKTKGVSIVLAKLFTFRLTSQLTDPEGRFLFLKGTWKDRPVTLANIYCPSAKQVTFLKETLLHLTTSQSGLLILGGTLTWP